MTDFLALNEHEADDLFRLIGRAKELKRLWDERRMPQSLADRRIALVVDDGGWRNTTAFDLGIQAMSGICVHAPISLDGGESIGDLARYLDNWVDAVIVRTPSLEGLRELAAAARAPVINARTRANHPCETLGDLSFISSELGGLDGLKVAAFAADGNILRSWVEAASVLPIEVIQVFPQAWHMRDAALAHRRFRTTTDMHEALDADVVITDCWPKDGPAEELLRFQITAALLDRLKPRAVFIPCPPVGRGKEVSADAMTASRCRVFEAKAFLLHAQNAVLEWIVA